MILNFKERVAIRWIINMLTALIARLTKIGNGKCLYLNKKMLHHLKLSEQDYIRVDFSEPEKIVLTKATDILSDKDITDIINDLKLI